MPTPWNLFVLTQDFLVEGQIDGSDSMQRTIFNLAGRSLDSRSDVTLTGVRVYPTGELQFPGAPPTTWTVGVPSSVLVVIPNDAPSHAQVLEKRDTAPAEMLVGPYLVRGNVFVNLKYRHREVATAAFTLKDAEISRLGSESRFAGYKAPLVLVNTFWLQGVWFSG